MLNRGLTLIFRKVKSFRRPSSCASLFGKSASPVKSDFSSLFFQRRAYAKKTLRQNNASTPEFIVPPAATENLNAKVSMPVESAPSPDSAQMTKTGPFEERMVAWDYAGQGQPTTLKFRVTYYGIGGFNASWSGKWLLPKTEGPIIAPFFNREDVLLDMLRSLYHNAVQRLFKPKYSIQMMSPGAGKTRMLCEWIMQAFANRKVIDGFLADFTDTSNVANEEPHIRKQFLNSLYRSAYKQHTILSFGEMWHTEDQSVTALREALARVVSGTILDRHNGQSIKFNGREIQITPETAKDSFGLSLQLPQLVKLFIALADVTYDDPEQLPFPEEGLLPGKTNVFFCIDECQTFSQHFKGRNKTDALYLLFRNVAARNHDSMEEIGISPFWFAVGTNLIGRFFDLEGQQSQFEIIIPSLGNLLDIKYLAQLCKQFLKHKLPAAYLKDTSDLPEMKAIMAKALIRNYLKTFGNPRAVAYFVRVAIEHFNRLSTDSSPNRQKRIDDLDKEIGRGLLDIFRPITLKGTPANINKLNVAAALCSEMAYDKPIRGLNVTPKSLASVGYLSIWKRELPKDQADGLARFYFSRPFFNLTEAEMESPILPSKVSETVHWVPYNISLASLVLEKDCADYLTSNMKGECFEIAVASSLYARYSLATKKELPLYDIFPAKNMPTDLRNATVKLNGVVVLNHKVSPASRVVFDEIIRRQVVAIDVGNSEFADVLLPIKLQGMSTLIGFQCKQYARKPPIAAYVSNCEIVTNRGFYFVGIAPVQPDNAKFISMLSDNSKKFSFLAEASEAVSPLYLVGMSFVPPGLQAEEKEEDKE